MSELKAYLRYSPGLIGLADYYIKSEADKVIANRDCEIKKLKDSISKLLKAKTEQIMDEIIQKTLIYGDGFVPVEHAMKLVAEIRHHKYKRCLDKAEMCQAKYDEEDAKVNGHYSSWEYTSKEMKYWERWRWRWLTLAEKFKEAK